MSEERAEVRRKVRQLQRDYKKAVFEFNEEVRRFEREESTVQDLVRIEKVASTCEDKSGELIDFVLQSEESKDLLSDFDFDALYGESSARDKKLTDLNSRFVVSRRADSSSTSALDENYQRGFDSFEPRSRRSNDHGIRDNFQSLSKRSDYDVRSRISACRGGHEPRAQSFNTSCAPGHNSRHGFSRVSDLHANNERPSEPDWSGRPGCHDYETMDYPSSRGDGLFGSGRSEHANRDYGRPGFRQSGLGSAMPMSSISEKLERIGLPSFGGESLEFEDFWNAFYSLVDQGSESDCVKMMRLKKCLRGQASECLAGLGFSSAEYEAAKEILFDRYGGTLREAQTYLVRLRKWPVIPNTDVKSFDKFFQFCRATVAKLKATKRYGELGPGALCNMMIEKLPYRLRLAYHRWVQERGMNVTAVSLVDWMAGEVRVQLEALEGGPSGSISTSQPRGSAPQTRGGCGVRTSEVRSLFVEPELEHDRIEEHCARSDPSSEFADLSVEGEPQQEEYQIESYWNGNRFPCKVCSSTEHSMAAECIEFLRAPVKKRWTFATNKGLCYRCLSPTHTGRQCRKNLICGIEGCSGNHHTLLHGSEKENKGDKGQVTSAPGHGSTQTQETSPAAYNTIQSGLVDFPVKSISLRTIPAWVEANGHQVLINCVLDDGSNESFLSQSVATRLGVSGSQIPVTVHTLNDDVETFQSSAVEIKLVSFDKRTRRDLIVRTCPKRVTGGYQAVDFREVCARYPYLGECGFFPPAEPRYVDLLIGTDYADLHAAFREISGGIGEPVARLGPLGWTCVGPIAEMTSERRSYHVVSSYPACCDLDATLRGTWEMEMSGSCKKRPTTREEQAALETVMQSIVHDGERYQVAVPWKRDPCDLPNNREMAEKRSRALETKLKKQPHILEGYEKIIENYLQKGYIREVPQDGTSVTPAWYLPHFAVIRPDKVTTKIRMVLDAAAKQDGVSLNDFIMVGPNLQTDLFEVLLRFRRFRVALVSDLAEMYLQVRIDVKDRRFFRIIWQGRVYEFERVCFGKNSAPMEAIAVVRKNAERFAAECPLAADAILNSTYMDDTLYSTPSVDLAITAYEQLTKVWSYAGMKAKKWCSNDPEVLAKIDPGMRAKSMTIPCEQEHSQKALGVNWLTDSDTLNVVSGRNSGTILQKYSKREMLKISASIYDPMGMMNPFTIKARIILQETWSRGYNWDQEIDGELFSEFSEWVTQLREMEFLKTERCLFPCPEGKSQLVVFADASKLAYACVIYARTVAPSGEVIVRFVTAKARVAPLASVSIPKLELQAALIACRVVETVGKVLEIPRRDVYYFSDSMDVLWWVRGRGRNYRPFVENRIGEIQSLSDPERWQYVSTTENPADLATRGISVQQLRESRLWWRGPEWMLEEFDRWPRMPSNEKPVDQRELKKTVTLSTQTGVNAFEELVDRNPNASFAKLCRVVGLVQRFVGGCRPKIYTIKMSFVQEHLLARQVLIMTAQKSEFGSEYAALSAARPVGANSKIAKMAPWIDENGIIRGRGRLEYADFVAYSAKYPIILPPKHRVTVLILTEIHISRNHRGTMAELLTILMVNYWLPTAREILKRIEAQCVGCRKLKGKPLTQQMAPLSKNRLLVGMRPFTACCVDYAGPFLTKQGRGKAKAKRWICLFTCPTVRAIHLELAFGLDTDSFLRALARFVGRRGKPKKITADNGTNFKGVVKEWDMESISNHAVFRDIEFEFNPPTGPHFGGIHEVMVRSVKRALPKVLDGSLTDEELTTVLVGVESDLNNRPLTYVNGDLGEGVPLTPNHFLVGQLGGPFCPETEGNMDLRRRWKVVNEFLGQMWNRMLREMLPMLNHRTKWYRETENLKVGDLVIVMDDRTPRGHWPLGRIVDVFPGRDAKVRVCRVRVGSREFVRPIVKLIPLEISDTAF